MAMGDVARRASVIGTGLIGGSIGLALRARGWHVTGMDADEQVVADALRIGALDAIGIDPESTITFVATPVGAVPDAAATALAATAGVVTDVGGIKASVVEAVDDERFVGGHPMAGSEQLGVSGAHADLFEGAVWVLTPDVNTSPTAYALARSVISELGADALALSPVQHDELVAVVSHVPHLTAAALMRLASGRAAEHGALLRLAAGGFRDMTRVAAGSPAIWPDICAENRDAICSTIDGLIATLGEVRDVVAEGERQRLLDTLTAAQSARLNLPRRVVQPSALVEVRVPVPDRPGVLAEVTTLAGELDVNIADLEIAHSSEGDEGVLLLLVESDRAEAFRTRLIDRGYRPALHPLE